MTNIVATEIERIAKLISKQSALPKQPVKAVIVDVIVELQRILFPEVFENENISSALEKISKNIAIQTELALRSDLQYKNSAQSEVEKAALDITLQFISKIPAIKEKLETDVEAVYNGDPAAYSKAEIIMSYPGIYAGMIHRIAHELYLLSVPLIPRMMSEHAHSATGIDIHPGAAIGKYFCMDHGTGIVVGESTVIGDHVKLYQGVTLGALSTKGGQDIKGTKRHPTINDNVTVYSGATILGGSTVIGEGVVIGGNAFIVKSVPENTRVSVKNPELQYKNNRNISADRELDQMEFWRYDI